MKNFRASNRWLDWFEHSINLDFMLIIHIDNIFSDLPNFIKIYQKFEKSDFFFRYKVFKIKLYWIKELNEFFSVISESGLPPNWWQMNLTFNHMPKLLIISHCNNLLRKFWISMVSIGCTLFLIILNNFFL